MHDIPPQAVTIIVAVLSSSIVSQWIPSIFAFFSKMITGKKKATLDDVMKKVENLDRKTDENLKSIKKLETNLERVEFKTEEDKALITRKRILQFNDEVVRNTSDMPVHSKEHWLEIMRDIDYYEEYTQQHPDFKNNYATESIRNLKGVFQFLMHTHKL